MQKKIRPDPLIPDHEVLRKIGGGAYGEVWLARGVTGAMRAVKIVYREDFSDERTFEREFEGILRFEPISRDHGGFVNILHVGRSDDQSEFYYYVMELGDDAHEEGEINPVEYEPRTLRTDMLRANGAPLPTKFCIDTGRRLADALEALHQRGLSHRDVKPSNVIFVDGKAKLADIGLVAAKDQRTFVGTEGFVPPEGPGSAAADIYGLGKVLYEMATGMDRLQFPELPDKSPGDDHRKKWIRLNRMICDVCDPRISKRKIKSGHELAECLARLQKGKGAVKKVPVGAKVGFALLAIMGLFASQIWIEKTWGTHIIEGKREPMPVRYVMVKILTAPAGAELLNSEGESVGFTPTNLLNQEIGTMLKFSLRAQGYRELAVSQKVRDNGGQVMLIKETLPLFSPPKEGEPWKDALGNTFHPHGVDGDQHVSTEHVSEKDWGTFLKETKKNLKPIVFEHGGRKIVAVSRAWADDYSQWLMNKCVREGYFKEYSEQYPEVNRQIIADYDLRFMENKLPDGAKKDGKILRPFFCLVRPIPYGTINVDTIPTGAQVYLDGVSIGVTPYREDNVPPGYYELKFGLGGWKSRKEEFNLPDGGSISGTFSLEDDNSLEPGKRWVNSLGMVLEPLGDDLMVSAWEIRSQDYRAYLQEKEQGAGEVFLDQDPLVPVAGVTRAECIAFCRWLTGKERGAPNLITDEFRYRLPTDREWSLMVGLIEVGETLAERENESRNVGVYPWGEEFPPISGAGNYADVSAIDLSDRTISGYEDGFVRQAPVGKFTKNIFGLFDLGGNVHEWISDSYPGDDTVGILRGGGWNTFSKSHLESRSRYAADVNAREDFHGFRVVLAKDNDGGQKERDETEVSDGRDSN